MPTGWCWCTKCKNTIKSYVRMYACQPTLRHRKLERKRTCAKIVYILCVGWDQFCNGSKLIMLAWVKFPAPSCMIPNTQPKNTYKMITTTTTLCHNVQWTNSLHFFVFVHLKNLKRFICTWEKVSFWKIIRWNYFSLYFLLENGKKRDTWGKQNWISSIRCVARVRGC